MELKVLRILAAFLTVACFISCNDDSSKSTLTVADYFPLEVNNKWTYSNGNIEWTEEVTAYKQIDGKEYAVVLRTYQRSIDTTYYRSEDNNKVYIYFQGEESLFIDFERAKGEEWESYHEFYAKVNSTGGKVTVPAGTFDNVVEIFSDNRQISDAFEFRKYAPGVGLIKLAGFRRESELIRAYVNGSNYPQ